MIIILVIYMAIIFMEFLLVKIKKRIYYENKWYSHDSVVSYKFYPKLPVEYPDEFTEWKSWKIDFNFSYQFILNYIIRVLFIVAPFFDFFMFMVPILEWYWSKKTYFKYNISTLHIE